MENKLPKFLIKALKINCFLGDNKALPSEDDYPYVYKLMARRYSDVVSELKKTYNTLDTEDLSFLKKHLSTLFLQAREIEKPIKQELEKICSDTVCELFEVPNDSVKLECKLVDVIQPKYQVNITPQSNDIIKHEYEDIDEIETLKEDVLKRRIINAMIQGSSYLLSKCYHLYLSKLFELDKRLPSLYDEIVAINNFILFNEDNKITDENKYQGAYVEVIINNQTELPIINSQGLIFPFLLMETIRGFMEMFASKGLPQDNKQAKYVLAQADFLLAEPWDLRVGVELWKDIIYEDEVKAKYTPYFFSILCQLETNEFNVVVKNILSKTKIGKNYFDEMLSDAKKLKENDYFDINIIAKHSNMLNDGYYSNDELDGLITDEEEDNVFGETYFHLSGDEIGCDDV